ncbi:MAG TPA: adenylate/guanylate cyclase domain-containing protein, partial [Motiliproteus sp.]
SGLFGHYVPPSLVEELQQQQGDLGLGGDSREMSVLFADIRDFTSLSEQLSPQQLSQLMNSYLSPMTEEIHAQRGTIDKYIGDAIMAFWGAPLRDSDHSQHALQAALAMLERLQDVNRELAAADLPQLRIGIGLNSGEMNVGNMGSRFRMAYTVLGDAVNLASRLEGLTKLYGVELIVSDSVVAANPEACFRQLDRVRVKGKQQAVAIYQPLPASRAAEPTIQAALALHQQLIDAYNQRHWELASRLCEELNCGPLQGALYDLYRQRIELYRSQPETLGEEWDGVFVLQRK